MAEPAEPERPRQVSTTQLPIETKVAPVGKSYSALDFQTDFVVCVNSSAKVYKLIDNIEIMAVSCDLRSHTKRCGNILHPAPNDVDDVSVRKKLDTLVENSAIAMHTRLP